MKRVIASDNDNTTSTALTVIKRMQKCEEKYFSGDPATMFHELRRFLFTQGVDSKLYSVTKIPVSSSSSSITGQSGNSLKGVSNVDNGFFSEFRSMVAVESAEKRTVVNTLIFSLRVFINSESDGNQGIMQIVLNHLHDGIFDLEDMYSALIKFLYENSWEQSPARCEARLLSLTSNMVFERSFSGVHEFTSMYYRLKPVLEFHQMVGSHLPIEAPF